MTPAEIGRFLAAAPSIRWVNLTGGEPSLREDLVALVEEVHRALPGLAILSFPTTGQRTERIVESAHAIAALRIPRFFVTVSIEGPPALHDELRGRPGAFDRAVETFRGLRGVAGLRTAFGITLSDANAHLVEATRAALAARIPGLGWRDLHFNAFTVSPHYYGNEACGLRAPRAVERALAPALRAREASSDPTDRIEATYLRLLPRYLATGRSPIPCKSLRASVFVTAAGDLYPCTVWDRRLGNVLERPLHEILDEAAAREARRVIERDACPGCWSPCEAHPTIVASAPGSLARC
jgi:radical SAM protein with 4Fe4S-binding SPASM domain